MNSIEQASAPFRSDVPRVALIAHDARKEDLTEWTEFNCGTLSACSLVATGTTGALIVEKTGLHVDLLLSGPLGGDAQVGAMLVERQLDLIVFFWDPLTTQPHDVDVKALLRLAVLYNIPIACNRATADFLISSPLFADKAQLRTRQLTSRSL
ncbi:MAG TPA: methylglyoxal synthase [Candidatus Lustribacter sp.]